MRSKIILKLLLLCASIGLAQPDTLWTTAVGSEGRENCNSAVITSDGSFLIGGNSSADGKILEFGLAKVSSEGQEIWFRKCGGLYQEFGYSVFELADNNYIIAGNSRSYGQVLGRSHGWVVKYSPDGDSLWAQAYGIDTSSKFYDGVPTDDGGFVAAGEYSEYIWMLKADSDGEVLWERFYEIGQNSYLRGMNITADGGFVLTGRGYFNEESRDCYLAKTDAEGNPEWLRYYGTEADDAGTSVIQTSDSGYLVAGYVYHGEDDAKEFYAVRTDSLGEMLWDRSYARGRSDICNSVVEIPGNGFVLAGYSQLYLQKYYLIRIDSVGDTLWTSEYGLYDIDPSEENLSDILLLEDGGYALAGHSNTRRGHGTDDFWLVRTEPDPVSVPYILDPAYPDQYTLHTPWPNPFNSTVNLSFDLPRPSRIRITIVDDLGRELETISEGWYPTGSHHAAWRAENVPAGMYVARMQTGEGSFFRRMLLVK